MGDRQAQIENAARAQGLSVIEWREDPDNGTTAVIGTMTPMEDNDDVGHFAGDPGEMTAIVVGSPEYNNERVAFFFCPEGMTDGDEVAPMDYEHA